MSGIVPASAKALFESLILKDQCSVVSVSNGFDTVGDVTEHESPGKLCKCLIQPLSAAEKDRAGYARDVTVYSVSLSFDVGVKMSDRVKWRGLTMEITGIMGPDSDQIIQDCTAVVVSNGS